MVDKTDDTKEKRAIPAPDGRTLLERVMAAHPKLTRAEAERAIKEAGG